MQNKQPKIKTIYIIFSRKTVFDCALSTDEQFGRDPLPAIRREILANVFAVAQVEQKHAAALSRFVNVACFVCFYIYKHTHTYIHTHIHTYTHTQFLY